jgi:hypothetical protein
LKSIFSASQRICGKARNSSQLKVQWAAHTLITVRSGAIGTQKMLKMKIEPDELLKTKGKLKPKIIDPDGCLKINELREDRGEA